MSKYATKEDLEDLEARLSILEDFFDIKVDNIKNWLLYANKVKEGLEEIESKESFDLESKKITKMSIGFAELEGTEEQLKAFEKGRKVIDELLFPRGLSRIEALKLALNHGLSIKSIS